MTPPKDPDTRRRWVVGIDPMHLRVGDIIGDAQVTDIEWDYDGPDRYETTVRMKHLPHLSKETPVSKHPETTTEWLEDIALELHAITGLLNERLPEPEPQNDLDEIAADNLEAFKHEAETPMRGHGDCCDAPDEAHITLWRGDEVERLLAANRDLIARAENAEAERDEWKAKAERVDDSARHWMNRCHAAEEKAEAERDERADDLEGLLQAARADRDTWEAAYKRADNLLSRTRDERDTALANQKVSAAALQGALKGGHEWHRRYEALQEGIRDGLSESRDMQSEVRASVTLAYLQSVLDELLDPTEGDQS